VSRHSAAHCGIEDYRAAEGARERAPFVSGLKTRLFGAQVRAPARRAGGSGHHASRFAGETDQISLAALAAAADTGAFGR
jgi:hypothetical protein